MKRMAVLVLVCCLLLTGCSTVDSTADILADGIAGQVESMYVDGRQTTSASTPDRDSALAPTVSAVDLADQARREYEALKMQNWGTPMGQALISDLDGNGIPELILVTNQILDIQDNDGSVSQEPACVFSVYTYGESGLQTLISDWPTRCVIAGGNDLVIGADSRDGQPVVVALYLGETTSANFGDVGYEGEIHVEAVNPFTGQLLEELDQGLMGGNTIYHSDGELSEKVSHYTYLTLDENGILTFPRAQAAAPIYDD